MFVVTLNSKILIVTNNCKSLKVRQQTHVNHMFNQHLSVGGVWT